MQFLLNEHASSVDDLRRTTGLEIFDFLIGLPVSLDVADPMPKHHAWVPRGKWVWRWVREGDLATRDDVQFLQCCGAGDMGKRVGLAWIKGNHRKLIPRVAVEMPRGQPQELALVDCDDAQPLFASRASNVDCGVAPLKRWAFREFGNPPPLCIADGKIDISIAPQSNHLQGFAVRATAGHPAESRRAAGHELPDIVHGQPVPVAEAGCGPQAKIAAYGDGLQSSASTRAADVDPTRRLVDGRNRI